MNIWRKRLRIIAGSARGRLFDAPKGMDTRPTLDRVKEAMFGSVQFDLPGSTVLDLFSGSGNLGLEAASRGAASVLMNDRSMDCVRQIRQNAEKLGLSDGIAVWNLDYREAIERLRAEGRKFDIAFLDAPYADGTAQDAAERLFNAGLIQPLGFVILEHAWNMPPRDVPGCMQIVRSRKFGICGFSKLKGADCD